jgi:hypothetical protein
MEITEDQMLYVLLERKEDKTEKDKRIHGILKKKAKLGSCNLKMAEEECGKQGWVLSLHTTKDIGPTTKYGHEIKLSESGLAQIDKFWRESKCNPINVWKARVLKWTPAVGALVTILLSYEEVWQVICMLTSFL